MFKIITNLSSFYLQIMISDIYAVFLTRTQKCRSPIYYFSQFPVTFVIYVLFVGILYAFEF